MNLKRNVGLFILLFVVGIFSSQRISAQGFGGAIDNAVVGMQEPLRLLFGDVSGGGSGVSPGEILLIKLLVFILLFSTVSLILKRVPNFRDNRAVQVIISLVVSILAVRYITTDSLVNFIWLPYGVLGIVFSVILPFVIGFYFIEGFDSSALRKVAWSTYGVIFAGLTYMRWGDLSTGGAWYQNLAWMYLAIAVLSFLLLFFDKEIHYWMFMSAMRGVDDVNKRAEAAKLTKKIEEEYAVLNGLSDSKARHAILNKIAGYKRSIKDIMRS